MKKILKKEVIIAFIIGLLIASGITVYAYSYAAKDVSYTKPGENAPISVESALNELYSNSKDNKTPQQVATLTTQDASYTFQNDGYIIGTVEALYNQAGGMIYFNTNDPESSTNLVFTAQYNESDEKKCSIYVPKGITVYTRKNYGTYNLTCYEFK